MGRPVLLVGEAPNPATVGRPALWLRPDSSGKRHSANLLLGYTGWTWDEYMRIFERTNLSPIPAMPKATCKARAKELLELAARQRQVVLVLGRRAAPFFSLGGQPYFSQVHFPGLERSEPVPCFLVPHPSGRNLWWNEQENRDYARSFFTKLKGAVGG